jgi:hypothetical protein
VIYDDATTVSDVLGAWDRGDSIWSVEMGGLGPGYEQCIQVLAVEILREKVGTPLPADGKWENWGDEVVDRLNAQYGFSGAQVGAAKNIAACFLKQGPRRALDSADSDRHIQVSRDFPGSPRDAPGGSSEGGTRVAWVRLTSACILVGRSQNVLYRLAAAGEVRTRRDASGRLEFRASDLKRLARAGARPADARQPATA